MVWLQIILWVLALILKGASEESAVERAASHFGVSASEIRKHL